MGWMDQGGGCLPEIRVADCQYNAAQIQKTMQQAGERGAQLLVLPELCLDRVYLPGICFCSRA